MEYTILFNKKNDSLSNYTGQILTIDLEEMTASINDKVIGKLRLDNSKNDNIVSLHA